MQIIIIEDENLAADRLLGLVQQYDPAIRIQAILSSVEKAILWLKQNPMPDLAFMDIQLSDGLCFEIFETVSVTCPIIFTTSYEQYALEAFGVTSVAYLLKPVKYGQLVNSFQKLEIMKQTFSKGLAPVTESGIHSIEAHFKSRFLVKNGLHIRAIKCEEIAYFYSEDKVSFLVSFNKQKFPVDYSLEEIETTLNPDIFFRISRKYIVHVDAIQEIRPYFKGRLSVAVSPAGEEDIIVSADRTPSFKAWLDR
ncbi:LytR/AlgR family response regulator transcription factor [Dyadobacter tibetensis]|uniref:LytR/AlgR family response regulator transcription factor n=1 Tax=Dyadobacter tibetensis TaxID=1211851 RepID=UPI0004717700|nr:LytTR family DNA-binding domain-containing protein [Dyadobacter tibetensis]